MFVDLELTSAGGEFGAATLAALTAPVGGVVDLRALAKDRQKKDNHNMSE